MFTHTRKLSHVYLTIIICKSIKQIIKVYLYLMPALTQSVYLDNLNSRYSHFIARC